MPRPKKGSPEARAIGERLKAAREAKRPQVKQNDDIEQLKAQIAELKKAAFFQQPQAPSTKTVVTKYSFDPKIYPDPRPRLRDEVRLKPFAFDYHYELG